jgi:hypothetical protein
VNELIEAGDPRTKVVGKRRPLQAGTTALDAVGQLNALAAALRRRPFPVKRGVYRFTSHEDADEWMLNLQLR